MMLLRYHNLVVTSDDMFEIPTLNQMKESDSFEHKEMMIFQGGGGKSD